MAYVSLDPDALQTLIDGLKGYATTAITNRDDAVNVNTYEDSPTSLTDFSDIVGLHCASLEDEAADLQNRLDAARAANESGLTTTGADGRTIAYVIPEGMEDTAENATASNNVDTVNQAREDAASLSDYAKGGCDPDDWDALLARVQAGQDDPPYANALLANIDPGRLLDLPADIHGKMTARDAKDQTDWSLRPDAARDLTSALGHVLATASYTWPDDQAADYANKLADATEEKGKSERLKALNGMLMASQDVDVDEDGTAESVGLDYSDSMLTTLAQRMENYSPQKWDNTSPRDWLDRLGDFHDDSHLLLPKELYSDNPIAGVVHAMTGNPQAAQNWLVARPDGQGAPDPASADQTKETVQRVQDLVGWGSLEEKGWATDWATMAYEFDSQGWVSSDPAAMSQEERSYQDYASATAVSGILNGIGGGEKPVTLPDGARNLVSETLANHPDSVVESTESTTPGGPLSPWKRKRMMGRRRTTTGRSSLTGPCRISSVRSPTMRPRPVASENRWPTTIRRCSTTPSPRTRIRESPHSWMQRSTLSAGPTDSSPAPPDTRRWAVPRRPTRSPRIAIRPPPSWPVSFRRWGRRRRTL